MSETIEFFGAVDEVDPASYYGFPPHEQEEHEAPFILEVQLVTDEDVKKFIEITECDTIDNSGKVSVKSIWYPKLGHGERGSSNQYVWIEED
jgi:hypothetical protein